MAAAGLPFFLPDEVLALADDALVHYVVWQIEQPSFAVCNLAHLPLVTGLNCMAGILLKHTVIRLFRFIFMDRWGQSPAFSLRDLWSLPTLIRPTYRLVVGVKLKERDCPEHLEVRVRKCNTCQHISEVNN